MNKVSALEALKEARKNSYSRWNSGESPAAERLKSVCVPQSNVSFKLDKGASVFAIGSCFARNIEEVLASEGFDVKSLNLDVPYTVSSARKNGIINKYNPGSLYYELLAAFGDDEESDIFLNVADKVLDPHLKPGEEPQELEVAKAFRRNLKKYFRQIQDCDVVVLTMGMVECWYDNVSGSFLNQPPPPRLLQSDRDRFSFVRLEVDDVVDLMSKSISILKSAGVKNILLTTSPVAMNRTFTTSDIVVANCYSKSVLRVACEKIVELFDIVDYFPSFETVMYSDSRYAWQGDRAHASDYIVSQIISSFVARYVHDSTSIQEELLVAEADEIVKLRALCDKYKNMLIRNGVKL